MRMSDSSAQSSSNALNIDEGCVVWSMKHSNQVGDWRVYSLANCLGNCAKPCIASVIITFCIRVRVSRSKWQ